MVLKCPSCSNTFTLPDGIVSGKANCPHCGRRLDLGRMFRPGDLAPGTVLGGCRVEGLLGRGGMAVVYKARQLSLDRPVALKVLPTQFARNRQFVERFNREAAALARLSHPNIVAVLEKGVEGETYYFVMEYVEGKSLRDRLLREGRFPPHEVHQLMQGICAGLEFAHQNGVIHRDLKPGNILLDAAGTPKLADFGIARVLGTDTHEARQLTVAHTVMGSADYMAPEQREDAAAVDHRADIYSLGVMLYQMLTGQLPVGSFRPVARLVEGVPTAVDRVIRTALAHSPDDRYESVAKFLSALNHAFAETASHHAHRTHPPAHGSRKSSAAVLVAAAAAVVLIAGVAAVVAFSGRHPTPSPPPSPPPPPTPTVVTPSPPKVTTTHAVRPRPPVKTPEKTPPAEESQAVREALADIRRHLANAPDDFPGHVDRLKALILSHNSPDVIMAARKELNAVTERLNKAIADHLAGVKKQADALMEKRDFVGALRITSAPLPPHLSTQDARKEAAALDQLYRGKCWTAFSNDSKLAASLAEAGKTDAAVAVLRGVDYGIPELNKEAAAELAKLEKFDSVRLEQARKEHAKLRADLGPQLKKLWAERRYAEALNLASGVAAKAPDDAARAAVEPHLRAATLLANLWKAILEAAQARKGGTISVGSEKFTVKDVDGETLLLALGPGTIRRDIRKQLSTEDLYLLVYNWLDTSKKADDNLMLGLFLTYDAKPDPAAAARAFEKAVSLGASPQHVAALRSLPNGADPDTKEPAPKEAEPPGGFALDLNGASDFVEVPDERRKRWQRLKTFTAEAWVWRRRAPGELLEQYVLAKNVGWTSCVSFAIYLRDGLWAYTTGSATEVDTVVTRVSCPAGTWVHCALVYDNGVRTFFADGKLVHTSKAKQRVEFLDQPFYVGAVSADGNPTGFWSGGIDEVRISSVARYRAEFVPERPLKADAATHLLLHFEEGRGSRVRDSSSFDNHGIIRGAAHFLPIADFKPPAPQPPKGPPPPPDGPPPKAPPKAPANP